MQTLLEDRGRLDAEMVKSAGGLAGGIGGPGECGGICSPLMVLGLINGPDRKQEGLPVVVPLGQAYLRRFTQVHGSARCADIQPKGMRACLSAMCLSPPMLEEICAREAEILAEVPAGTRSAYVALLSAFERSRFHCAHSVLEPLNDVMALSEDARRASWVFVGGMVLSGATCGALTAGVMALSAKTSGTDHGYLKTIWMLVTMMFSAERAMRDEMSPYNRAIRLAGTLADWFQKEYGSTRCADLTKSDFTSTTAVAAFCGAGLERCVERTRRVAFQVRDILQND